MNDIEYCDQCKYFAKYDYDAPDFALCTLHHIDVFMNEYVCDCATPKDDEEE